MVQNDGPKGLWSAKDLKEDIRSWHNGPDLDLYCAIIDNMSTQAVRSFCRGYWASQDNEEMPDLEELLNNHGATKKGLEYVIPKMARGTTGLNGDERKMFDSLIKGADSNVLYDLYTRQRSNASTVPAWVRKAMEMVAEQNAAAGGGEGSGKKARKSTKPRGGTKPKK